MALVNDVVGNVWYHKLVALFKQMGSCMRQANSKIVSRFNLFIIIINKELN